LEATLPIAARLRTCLSTFTTILDTGDEAGLDPFIPTYQDDASEPIAEFASGLKQDIEAVKNCLRYPAISHGPMEGTHNKIKMVRRRGDGRAGLELFNARFTLPWYYYD
jgi:transposase